MNDHGEMLDTAGAWVLGALDEDEAWHFSAHLEVCASCRDEVARLRVATDALPLAAPPIEPPPELKQRLMAIVEAEAAEAAPRRRERRESPVLGWLRNLATRPGLAAAAASLLLLVGAGVGFAVRGGDEASPRVVALTADPGKARGARAELVQTDNGAEVRVSGMPAPPPGRVYQVWLQRSGQSPEPDAVFTVDRTGRGSVVVRGDAAAASAVLVTDEPQGGSTVPSRQPVLRGRLA